MTVDHFTATAIVTPLDIELQVNSVTPVFDEGWFPYGQFEIVCQMPDEADRAALDLRDQLLRLDLRIRRDFGRAWSLAEITDALGGAVADLTTFLDGSPLSALTNTFYRPWNGAAVRASQRLDSDLYITAREFDDEAQTLSITAQTDEALLNGDALIQDEPLDPETTSLRSIVALVLQRHGAILQPDSLDATVDEADATIWQPGTTAADYLDPLLEAASLRLWCDERRVWRISERQAAVDGAVVLTPAQLTGNRDRMTLDEPEVWCDSVVVEYRYTDEFGLEVVRRDIAGAEPTRAPLLVTRENTIYPGAGAATGILSRMQGRGRVLEARADADLNVRPGMAATINPPATVALTGYVSRVTFSISDAQMDVATRGLVDTPETSWLFTEPDIAWNDVPEGDSWLDYEPIGV